MNNIETGQHPTLHAFPTRRSSDLGAAAGEYAASAAGEYGRRSGVRAPVRAAAENSVCFGTGGAAGSARPDRRLRARSEEHTSELQSRGHLVCRLLLAKKKCYSSGI